MFNLIDIQYIQVTAQYSNAVLMALLPHFSDFAHKMDLPIPLPITVSQMKAFGCDNHLGDIGGAIRLTNDYVFVFEHGHVTKFKTRNCYYEIEDFSRIESLFGANRMTEAEAVELCRSTIRRLGYTEEQLYADLQAAVEPPPKAGTNTIPRYKVSWVDPRDDVRSCDFEVNSDEKKIEKIWFLNGNLRRAPPHVAVPQVPLPGRKFKSQFQPVNPKYAQALAPTIYPQIEDYVRRMHLPVPLPVSTNEISRYVCRKFDEDIYADMTFTNGYRFFYRRGMVEVMDAPDCFFNFPTPGVRVRHFLGKWEMNEAEATQLARAALTNLGYSVAAFEADKDPEIQRPYNVMNVPRYRLEWVQSTGPVAHSYLAVEVDAEKKQVKSINLWHANFWRPPPDLGVSPDVPEIWEKPPPDLQAIRDR